MHAVRLAILQTSTTMIDRIRDILFTPHPFERNALLLLAAGRAIFTGLGSTALLIGFAFAASSWPVWLRWTLYGPACLLIPSALMLLWADFIEHRLKTRILGYSYNPRVMAIGEFEAGNVPVLTTLHPESAGLLRIWQRHKYDQVYFRVLKDDVLDLLACGYPGISEGQFMRCLWEGDPGSGNFGGE